MPDRLRAMTPASQKRLPRRVPGIRLGRLAVALKFQGKRLGELLLMDAIARTRQVQSHTGTIGLFVDAIDEGAAAFYLRWGFQSAPDRPLLIFRPVR